MFIETRSYKTHSIPRGGLVKKYPYSPKNNTTGSIWSNSPVFLTILKRFIHLYLS